MVLARNDTKVPDDARYALRLPNTLPDLTCFNRMQIAWVLWAQRVSDVSERKNALRHAEACHRMNALAAAIISWSDFIHERMLLKRMKIEYGKPFIYVQRWKEECYRIENQLSTRNCVQEILEHRQDEEFNETMLLCSLTRGETRWVRLVVLEQMIGPRAERALNVWRAEFFPETLDRGADKSSKTKQREKEVKEKLRASVKSKIAGRTRASPKKAPKKKKVPEASRRQDPLIKNKDMKQVQGDAEDEYIFYECDIDSGVIIAAAKGAPPENASDEEAEEDTHYKTKFLDLMGDNGGRALTKEEQETIRAEAADAAVAAAAIDNEAQSQTVLIANLRRELEVALGAQAVSPAKKHMEEMKLQVDEQQLEHMALLEQVRLEEEASKNTRDKGSSMSDDIWARLKLAQTDGGNATKLQKTAKESPQVCAGIEKLIADSTVSTGEAKLDALVREIANMKDKMLQLEVEAASAAGSSVPASADDVRRTDFAAKVDLHVHVHEEKCRINQTLRQRCLNVLCDFRKSPGVKFCKCGAPASYLDLKCHKCDKHRLGSAKECLEQPDCLHCLAPNRTAMTSKERAKDMLKDATKEEPPTLVQPQTFVKMDKKTKESRAAEPTVMDNLVALLARMSNSEENLIIGLNSNNISEMIDDLQDCRANSKSILGSEPDFELAARPLLAVVKGLEAFAAHGLTPRWKVRSTEVTCRSTAIESNEIFKFDANTLKDDAEPFDATMADAPLKLGKLWSNLTKLIKHVLGSVLAAEHQAMCDQLMAAFEAEERPQWQFSIDMIIRMHAAAIAWWRQAMEAYIRKSTMLEANFGDDLLWSCIGTSAERPMLHVRSLVNGKGRWANFLDRQFFRKGRQQARKNFGNTTELWGKSPVYKLAKKPRATEFAQANKGRAVRRRSAMWPVEGSHDFHVVEFTSKICAVCLELAAKCKLKHDCELKEKKLGADAICCSCTGSGHKNRARNDHGTTIWDMDCIEVALKKGSPDEQAQAYKTACIKKYSRAAGGKSTSAFVGSKGDLIECPKPKDKETATEDLEEVKLQAATDNASKTGEGMATQKCSACGESFAKSGFSKRQWSAEASRRRCVQCIEGAAAESAAAKEAGSNKQSSTKEERRIQALKNDEAIPGDSDQPQLGDYVAKLDILHAIESKESVAHLKAHKDSKFPAGEAPEGCLMFQLTVPLLRGGESKIRAWAMDRGMTVRSAKECQDTRCLFVVLAHGAGVDAWQLFDDIRRDAAGFLDIGCAVEVWSEIAAANLVQPREQRVDEIEETAYACGLTAANLIVRSQACDLAFLRFAWPKLLGKKSVLNVYEKNGHTMFELYIAAEGKGGIESALDEEVIHLLCHDGHAFATEFEEAKDLKTLRQVLRFLGSMNRMSDVGIICCTSFEHTKQGRWYSVPEYIAGHDLLNCAKSIQVGFMVGGRKPSNKSKVAADAVGDQQADGTVATVTPVAVEESEQIRSCGNADQIMHQPTATRLASGMPPNPIGCLCCGDKFVPAVCPKKSTVNDPRFTVYCKLCWNNNKHECNRRIKSIMVLQKWWKHWQFFQRWWKQRQPRQAAAPSSPSLSQSFTFEDDGTETNSRVIDHATRTRLEVVQKVDFNALHRVKDRWDGHPAIICTRIKLLQWQIAGQFSDSTDFEVGEAITHMYTARITLDTIEAMKATARATLKLAGANTAMWCTLVTARWAFRMAERMVGAPVTSNHGSSLSSNLQVMEQHTNAWREIAVKEQPDHLSRKYSNAEGAIEWAELVTPTAVSGNWQSLAAKALHSDLTGEVFEHMRAIRHQEGPEGLAKVVTQEIAILRLLVERAVQGGSELTFNCYLPPRTKQASNGTGVQPACVLKKCSKDPVPERRACCKEHFLLAKEQMAIHKSIEANEHIFNEYQLLHAEDHRRPWHGGHAARCMEKALTLENRCLSCKQHHYRQEVTGTCWECCMMKDGGIDLSVTTAWNHWGEWCISWGKQLYIVVEQSTEEELLSLYKLFVESEREYGVPLKSILAKLKAVDIHHKKHRLNAPFENIATIELYTRRLLVADSSGRVGAQCENWPEFPVGAQCEQEAAPGATKCVKCIEQTGAERAPGKVQADGVIWMDTARAHPPRCSISQMQQVELRAKCADLIDNTKLQPTDMSAIKASIQDASNVQSRNQPSKVQFGHFGAPLKSECSRLAKPMKGEDTQLPGSKGESTSPSTCQCMTACGRYKCSKEVVVDPTGKRVYTHCYDCSKGHCECDCDNCDFKCNCEWCSSIVDQSHRTTQGVSKASEAIIEHAWTRWLKFTSENQVPALLDAAALTPEFVNHMCSKFAAWAKQQKSHFQVPFSAHKTRELMWAIDVTHMRAGLPEPFSTSKAANKIRTKNLSPKQGGRVARAGEASRIESMFSKANTMYKADAMHKKQSASQHQNHTDGWQDCPMEISSDESNARTKHDQHLEVYAQARGGNAGAEQREFAERVNSRHRKHRISSSNSQEPKRPVRARKKAMRFTPGASQSPRDDSGSYSEDDLQQALPTEEAVKKIKRRRQLRTKAKVAAQAEEAEISEDDLPISAATCKRCFKSKAATGNKVASPFCKRCWRDCREQCLRITSKKKCTCLHEGQACGRKLCSWEAGQEQQMCTLCLNDQHGSSRSPNAQSEDSDDDELQEHHKLPTNSQVAQSMKIWRNRTVQPTIAQAFSVKHFSKYQWEDLIEVVAETENVTSGITKLGLTRKCSTCKACKEAECYTQGARTCSQCKAKRVTIRANRRSENVTVSRAGKSKCSSGGWCQTSDFKEGNKTCDGCIAAAKANTQSRKECKQAAEVVAADFEAAAGGVKAAVEALSKVTAGSLAQAVLQTAMVSSLSSLASEQADAAGEGEQDFGLGLLVVSP